MHFVILFSVCILFGGASGCDMCKIDFGNFATCTGEDVCPLYASYVEVECFIRNITTLVPIGQLRILCKNLPNLRCVDISSKPYVIQIIEFFSNTLTEKFMAPSPS